MLLSLKDYIVKENLLDITSFDIYNKCVIAMHFYWQQ